MCIGDLLGLAEGLGKCGFFLKDGPNNRPETETRVGLPAVELEAGEKLETVVALQYRVEEKENGLKSKLEIK
jgi:hypothetical protein